MGREFTNEQAQTPLWRFAIRVYPHFKVELLNWQNTHNVNVNDIIGLAFATKHRLALPAHWWEDRYLAQLRLIIEKVRALRVSHNGNACYESAKELELQLELIDLQQLQQMLQLGDSTENIKNIEIRAGVKKGAIAPLIQRISNT